MAIAWLGLATASQMGLRLAGQGCGFAGLGYGWPGKARRQKQWLGRSGKLAWLSCLLMKDVERLRSPRNEVDRPKGGRNRGRLIREEYDDLYFHEL